MKRVSLCALILFLTIFIPTISHAIQSKGIKVVIKDRSGREVGLYKGSHALLIGVSRYTAGWPSLESVPGEIDRIETALKIQSFHVEKVLNPTSDQLSTAFENFIDRYGFDRDNRLLFFFSGHGHTRKEGKKGYLVPTDAPDPRSDDKGFVRKALGMGQVLTWARRIEAKHALFVFDSCFSGTIFRAKALPKHPPHISDITSRSVRQFISAGSAGEEVPAQSVFVPSFIRALRGEADLDGDGYVTGTELGMYLHKKVLSYETGQTPQYGKIRDPDLDEGDFVFQLGKFVGSTSPSLEAEKQRLAEERARVKRERRELEQLKALIEEKKKLEAERRRLELEKKKLASVRPLAEIKVPSPYPKDEIQANDLDGEISKREILDKISRTQDYIVNAIEKVSPAVVNISTVKTMKGGSVFKKDVPSSDFFRRFFGQDPAKTFIRRRRSLGSGVIINKEGYTITSNHVIEGSDKIKVTMIDGKEYDDVKIIGRDSKTDLALIKIKSGRNLPAAMLGNSDVLKVGQWVIAIGNPFGLGHTASAGIINKNYSDSSLNFSIRTTSVINPGNSGGPLINISGEVVGICIALSREGFRDGYVIPINMVKELVAELK